MIAGRIAAALLVVAACQPAQAHGSKTGSRPVAGIEIPSLTHGQMAVIARYRRDILGFAARQPNPDMGFQRILNYANIQFSYCLWGLMPGSLSDEESPFNECSHAYLSAASQLLLRMRDMPRPQPQLMALADRIELDMIEGGSSLVLCRYSQESFDTANVIRPDWKAVVSRPADFAIPIGLLVLAGLAIWAAGHAKRKQGDGR